MFYPLRKEALSVLFRVGERQGRGIFYQRCTSPPHLILGFNQLLTPKPTDGLD